MSNKKTTLVVTTTPKMSESAAWQNYLGTVLELTKQAGGTLQGLLKTVEVVHGRSNSHALIITFEGREKLDEMYKSDAYKAIIEDRTKGFEEINILIMEDNG